MELEQTVDGHRDDVEPTPRDRRRRTIGVACAAGVFVGIGAAMVVAALTDNALAAVAVIGVAVVSALGAVMTLG